MADGSQGPQRRRFFQRRCGLALAICAECMEYLPTCTLYEFKPHIPYMGHFGFMGSGLIEFRYVVINHYRFCLASF